MHEQWCLRWLAGVAMVMVLAHQLVEMTRQLGAAAPSAHFKCAGWAQGIGCAHSEYAGRDSAALGPSGGSPTSPGSPEMSRPPPPPPPHLPTAAAAAQPRAAEQQRLVDAPAAAAADPGEASPFMPPALRRIESVVAPSTWEALVAFFGPGGGSERFSVYVDATCVDGDHRLDGVAKREWSGDWMMTSPDRSKWALEMYLPRMFAASKWTTSDAAAATASVVVFPSRSQPRAALSRCRRALAAHSPAWAPAGGAGGRNSTNPGSRAWFVTSTDRGPCCDGGQYRDPALLSSHFLSNNGELESGPWHFHEHAAALANGHAGPKSWRSFATNDTSPPLRCFDARKDVVTPPPSWIVAAGPAARAQRLALDREAADARNKTLLAFHVEGKNGPPEYVLRRKVSALYSAQLNPDVRAAPDPRLALWKSASRDEYDGALRRAKYCLVIEGFSAWTPRLTEAIMHGCVPAVLSPLYRLPFDAVLQWEKFSVRLAVEDVPRLPEVLEAHDHAALHANLLRVRALFAYCVEQGDCDQGDALPLVAFEMDRRAAVLDRADAPRATGGGGHAGRAANGLGTGGRDAVVDYECDADVSCRMAVAGSKEWQCTPVTGPFCECTR